MFSHAHVWMCAHVWATGARGWCLYSSSIFLRLFKKKLGTLHEIGAHGLHGNLVSGQFGILLTPLLSTDPCYTQTRGTFYVACMDLDLGIHASSASILLTEPFPEPLAISTLNLPPQT